MIVRTHQTDSSFSTAIYSVCESYRYALTREWGDGRRVMFIMLNPSTADERRNDPTVERCERRARALGCGAFRVTNLFAFRATDPRDLKRAAEPVGPANDQALREGAAWADMILCGWGAHGVHQARDAEVIQLLQQSGAELWHLGLTLAGAPRHPLYLSYAVQPSLWR
ncbi:DUF1643 domain-containing protein [Paracoccus caeni]|uniref:DUF1643 domain-containing protein n=1 Tax=Paracoccus caeni TaxID=657651 RepID=A0A934VZW0_9RHOB|nr:DUF1643 domain-containing protein [Paracoccus caeni]MBK4216270.1 DUF1643 domain-containing protein [Paracoccus caeni]